MKRLGWGGVVLAATLATAAARADTTECLRAATDGQKLRNAKKLIEARAQFQVCQATACPSIVQGDCARWAEESNNAVPTVVLSAKDAAGNDAIDVQVRLDGAPFASRLDGGALPVNPGPHKFAFTYPDGATLERTALIAEGQKAVVVAATREAPRPVTEPAPAAAAPVPALPPPPPASSPLRTAGWVTGGVGVAALAVGGVFTGVTLSDRSAAQCNAAGACTNFGKVSDAQSVAPVAGAGLIAGGALVLAGIALLIAAPRGEHPTQTSSVAVTPTVGPSTGGLVVAGRW